MATKIPKIRFSRFDAAWEQRKLIDEVELFGGLTYSPKDVVPSPGSIVLRSSNVKGGEISLDDNVYVLKEKATSTPVQLNDIIVVVRNGSRSLIGKHAIVKAPLNNAVIGAFMTGFRTKQPDFINVLMDTHAFKKAITENLGATINQITGGMLKQMVFFMPASEKEKRAIGNLFRTLDDALALHQKKLKHFKNLKESLLQNMFPREGEIFPRLRFPEFTDAWEQRKLGELGETRSGIGFPEREQGGKEGLPFYKVSDMNLPGNESIMVKANNYVTADQIASNKWFPITKVPAILFAKVGAAVLLNRKRLCGTPFLLDNNTMSYSLDPSIWVTNFAHALFETLDLTQLVQVGALPSYGKKDVEAIHISIPTLPEQEKIGNLFYLLENAIALHQRKLAQLKKLKTCLFNNLFVN